MQEAINAYAQTTNTALEPRQIDAAALIKAATLMQELKDNWESQKGALDDVLQFNRKLWTIFASSMADETHGLPLDVKNNVASLGVFVFKHTVDILKEPSPEKLDTLININHELAKGLRETPPA